MARISLNNGHSTIAVSDLSAEQVQQALDHIRAGYCDSEIRERLHNEISVRNPTADEERAWLDAYADAHKTKYGQTWVLG